MDFGECSRILRLYSPTQQLSPLIQTTMSSTTTLYEQCRQIINKHREEVKVEREAEREAQREANRKKRDAYKAYKKELEAEYPAVLNEVSNHLLIHVRFYPELPFESKELHHFHTARITSLLCNQGFDAVCVNTCESRSFVRVFPVIHSR